MNKGILKEITEFTIENFKKQMQIKYAQCLREMPAGVYIFGSGLLGKFALEQCSANQIDVISFLDNALSKQGNIVNNLEVLAPEVANKNIPVIICSVWWTDIEIQLINLGFDKILHYEELPVLIQGFDAYGMAFEGLHDDFIRSKDKLIHLWNMFADEKSELIYESLLKYRMSLDYKYLITAYKDTTSTNLMYFDTEILSQIVGKKIGIFVDGGGNLGETTKDFMSWCKNDYEKVLFFEPDENLNNKATENLNMFENIDYHIAGLGKEHGMLNYMALGGGVGSFSRQGQERIEVYAIDEFNFDKNKINIIKLDVEGFEMEILYGAKKTISEVSPVLILSAYHRPQDLYALVDYVTAINDKYRISLRHYTNTYCDTVLFFIPIQVNGEDKK